MKSFHTLAALLLWGMTALAGQAITSQAWAAGEIFAAARPEIAQQLQAAPALSGGGLFGPSLAAPQETPAAARPGTVRERSAAINPGYLQALIGAKPFVLDDTGALIGTPDRAVLNLFDDLKVDIVKLSESRSALGQQVLRAAVIGADGSSGNATIVIESGSVTAQITVGSRTILVQPGPAGAHSIIEFSATDKGTRHTDAVVVPPAPDEALRPSVPTTVERPNAGTVSQLRILVVYTPKALALLPSLAAMRSNIALMVDMLNATLSNSQVAAQFTLAGIDQVNYAEPTGQTSDDFLETARNNTGDFARIQGLRQVVAADLVSVISGYDDPTSCGIGYINTTLDKVSSLSPYTRLGLSAVSLDGTCLGGAAATFAHEVGHNLGADHDRYVLTNPQPGPTLYGVGYVDTVGRFRDTMAYDDQCNDAGFSCLRLPYYSNPNLTYNGRALGVADSLPAAADAARKIGEIAPYAAQFHTLLSVPAAPVLAMLVSGTGTITSSPAGINCGTACSASFTSGQQVTLTASAPTGWSFQQWSGACTGATTCTVSMTASRSVTATFVPSLRFGPVFSSAQGSSQSFLRVYNTGATAGTVTVQIRESDAGALLGQWNSPSIPAGTAPQFGISQIESAITGSGAKPPYYALSVLSNVNGYAQHILWKPADGTLTNLSTCEVGMTAAAGQVANVHSSVLSSPFPAYPSSIAINNTSASAATGLTLGIYDARNGAKLGTYTVASMPANSRLVLTVDSLEAAAHITPDAGLFHYIIKVEGDFTGFLQHLVNNQAKDVITDMTTVCAFDALPASPQTVAMLQPGPLYSTAQSTSQSFLRFTNTGSTAGTVAVTLRNAATGAKLGQWISAPIAPGASPQYGISDLENAIGIGAKPLYYAAQIETQMTGSMGHVLWKPATGTFTNLSTCDAGISANTAAVANVHSSLLAAGFPSTIAVTNTGAGAQAVTLAIYDARNGARLGAYTTAAIPAGGQVQVGVTTMEAAARITPDAGMYHYVVKIEGSFTGFLQHLVNNQSAFVITDMTTVCQLPAKAVSYADCSPNATPRCTTTLGAATAGQLKQINSWANYSVALSAGVAYTIQVKGASTGNGTLARPYLFIYSPSGGAPVASGGGGGTGNDAKLSFTPSSTGTYTIQVSTYILPDSAGTFVLTVQ